MSKPRGLFVPVYESLLRSVKLSRLSEALKKDRFMLAGHLLALWTWCLAGLPRVDFALTAEEVARAAQWPGRGRRSAEFFAEALAGSGFLDRVETGFKIHDWGEYGGKIVRKRQADRERHLPTDVMSEIRNHDDQGDSSSETPPNFYGISALDETRRDDTTQDDTTQDDTTQDDTTQDDTTQDDTRPDLLIASVDASLEGEVEEVLGIFEKLYLDPPSSELIGGYLSAGLTVDDWRTAAEQVSARRREEPIDNLDAWLRPKLDDLLRERTIDTRVVRLPRRNQAAS